MTTNGNWVAVRRGILQHVSREDEPMTHMEFAAYMIVLLDADKANGSWRGSAQKLVLVYHFAENTAYRVLKSLESKGYIKRLWIKGRKGNYRIVVNRYAISFGPFEGRLVDAAGTTDWQKPALVPDGNVEPDEEFKVEDVEGRDDDERAYVMGVSDTDGLD